MRVFFLLFLFVSINSFSQKKQNSHKSDEIQNNYIKKIDSLQKLRTLAKIEGNVNSEISILNEIIHLKTSVNNDYISSYIDSRFLEELVEKHPTLEASKQVKVKLYDNLSWFLQMQGNYKESINYINKAIDLSKEQKKNADSVIHLIRLAILEDELGNKTKSENTFEYVKNWAIEHNDIEFLAAQYESRCFVSLKNKDFENAIKYGKESIKLSNKFNRTNYNYIAESYLELKMPDSAFKYAYAINQAVVNTNLREVKRYSHDNLRKIYAALNDYEKAYYHFNEYYKIQQEINSFDNAMQIGNFNIEQEKQKAKLQQGLNEAKISNQRIILFLVSGSLLLLAIGTVYIFNRLNVIRNQNKIIAQEKARAELSEKHKEQFLANMSHEIRTPMNAISGMTNSLLRNPHPKNQDLYLQAMKTSSDNLLVLLNDILDLSKIESGKLQIDYETINPRKVVKDVVQILKFKAEEKGLELKIEVEKGFPKEVIGDSARLAQILINLVGNAVKFTHNGSITIKLTKPDDNIQFAIIDTGIGIKPDKIESIFNNFDQGEHSKSQIYGGSGLGLSISKRIIELLNGTIWVESKVNQGSIFYFKLPFQIEEQSTIKKSDYSADDLKKLSKSLKGLKFLIVEDDEFNIMVIQDDLSYYIENVSITIANNGLEAIDLYKKEDFDIILMDMFMPVMDGCEATKTIRILEKELLKNKTIIIAMTANIIKSEIDSCFASGMNAYIPKPYKVRELIPKIHKIISSK